MGNKLYIEVCFRILTTKQFVNDRWMSLVKQIPWAFSTHIIRVSILFFLYWSFFILKIWHDICEKFMTIMLKYWAEFIDNFLFNVIWWHNNWLLLLSTIHIRAILLNISFKPDILIELCEREWQSEVVFYPRDILEFSIFSIEEVIF